MTSLRIDKWLWAARFFKTRSLAKQAIETGKVDAAGQRAKSSRAVRVGDTLVVTRLDRLARSVGDLHQIIERLSQKKVAFRCLNQSGVDTSSSTGKLMLAVLGAVAQFENDIRRERQLEGITKAKADGRYRGRKASIDPARVKELHQSGLGPAAIARQMGIGRASVYRALAA